MENVRSFGDWLEKMRKSQGYSKASLSRETGIDRAHIRRMETGEIGLPEKETRDRLHESFGTSDADLESLGILIRREFPRADGTTLITWEAGFPPAADIGERAAIVEILDTMPDETVRRLRLFLEAIQ